MKNKICLLIAGYIFTMGALYSENFRININLPPVYDRNIHEIYEMPINLKKLGKCVGLRDLKASNTLLKGVCWNGKIIPIPFSVIKTDSLRYKESLIYRFPFRDGLRELYFEFGDNIRNSIKISNKIPNLFSGALEQTSKWKSNTRYITPVIKNGELCIESDSKTLTNFFKSDTLKISKTFSVPGEWKGVNVFASFDIKLVQGANYLPVMIQLKQYDENGKELHGCVVDLRWLTICLAKGQDVKFREQGRIRPQTSKIEIVFSIRCRNSKWWDIYGLGETKPSDKQSGFQIRISKIQLRKGKRVEFPGINKTIYAQGLTKENGDYSLKINRKSFLIFYGNPRWVWAEEGMLERNKSAIHWPVNTGTFELWFMPKKNNEESERWVFVQANSPHYIDNMLECYYSIEKKKFYLTLTTPEKESVKAEAVFDSSGFASSWNHLAICWDVKKGMLRLFLNGKKIIEKNFPPSNGIDLKKIKRPDRAIPGQIWVGVNEKIQYGFPHFFTGYIDELRVSDCMRYDTEFSPVQKNFDIDSHTRALFHLDLSPEGIHYGDDRFAFASLFSEKPLISKSITISDTHGKHIKTIDWTPKTLSDKLNPKKIFPLISYNRKEAQKNYNNSYTYQEKKFSLSPGEKISLQCSNKAFIDSLTISCPSDTSCLQNPLVRTCGQPDSTTLSNIVKTLQADKISDEQKRALRLFSYLVSVTDYYWHDTCEILPNGKKFHSGHDPHRFLTGYLQFGCGQLNTIVKNLFITAKLSANMTYGTGHLFEQVFYGNAWHLYDLSPRIFFPARDNLHAASLDELEKDPYLLTRIIHGMSFSHWLPAVQRGNLFGIKIRHLFNTDLKLYPGQSITYYWWNAGNFNNVIYVRKKVTTGGNLSIIKEMGKYNNMDIALTNNFPPHFANAVLSFKGKPEKTNPLFKINGKNEFLYFISSRYVIVDVLLKLKANFQSADSGIKLFLFSDIRQEWEKIKDFTQGENLKFDFGYKVRARRRLILKFVCQSAEIKEIESYAICQVNPRILTPCLNQGENHLLFTADKGKADIILRYREKAADIYISNGIKFGMLPGYERHLFVCEPGRSFCLKIKEKNKNKLFKPVILFPEELKSLTYSYKQLPTDQTAIEISVPENIKEDLYEIKVKVNNRIKPFQLLICKDAICCFPDELTKDNKCKLLKDFTFSDAGIIRLKTEEEAVFKQVYPGTTEYLFYTLMKPVNSPWLHYAVPDANGKYIKSAVWERKYLKQPGGWAWKPLNKNTFPIVKLSEIQGKHIRIKAKKHDFYFACIFIMPLHNKNLVEKMRHYLENYNYSPFVFANKWEPVSDAR